MNRLRAILKWRWIRALQIWNHTSIRAQGGVIALIPVAAVVVSFIFAIYGNNQRGWIEYDIQRRFKLVRQYNDLLKLMINAETGERGFLLTKRTEFLEPYNEAVTNIPLQIENLRQTILEEPGEKPRLERLNSLATIQDLINQQLASLKKTQEYQINNERREALFEHLQNGKKLMDSIRDNLGEMQERDAELLSERIDEINSIRKRDYILVFVTLLVGLLARLLSFYLFDRGIVRRVDRLRENVALLRENKKLKYPLPKKTDAIGLLEQEIVKIAEQKNLLSNSNE
jgi:CHASE3 domain sensor protein